MSQLLCPCGNTISDNTDNLLYKGEVVSDQDFERFWNPIVAVAAMGYSKEAFFDFLTSRQIQFAKTIYECLSCGRLLIQREPGSNSFVSFKPDSGKVENVLRSTSSEEVA